jgi:hypothetical protein
MVSTDDVTSNHHGDAAVMVSLPHIHCGSYTLLLWSKHISPNALPNSGWRFGDDKVTSNMIRIDDITYNHHGVLASHFPLSIWLQKFFLWKINAFPLVLPVAV